MSTNAEDLQDLNARTSWGGWQPDLHKIFSYGPVPDHVRTPRRFHQDLCKSFSQGPVQDHAKASDSISLGSPQDLRTRNCKRPWARSSYPKRISQDRHKRTCCCCSGSYKILIQAPPRHGICKLLIQLLMVKQHECTRQRDAQFVRACAVETHVDMSQEPFLTQKNMQEKCQGPEVN